MALPVADELNDIFYGGVKRKRNASGKLIARAGRVAKNSTEVMVKITGWGKGASGGKAGAHSMAHLNYISRHGKIELENNEGEKFSGKEAVTEMFSSWQDQDAGTRSVKNERETMHMVLSMPAGVEPDAVQRAVREFAREQFGNHEYAFALHTDAGHPHCHLAVKCKGLDGTRLRVGPDELQDCRESFATQLQLEGVDAEASPRRARGVGRQPESQVVRHIEAGDATHPPRVSKARAAKVRAVVDELAQEARGETPKSRAAALAAEADQRQVRGHWLAVAAAAEKDPHAVAQLMATQGAQAGPRATIDDAASPAPLPDGTSLARDIREFVERMPPLKSERQQIAEDLRAKFRRPEIKQDLPPPSPAVPAVDKASKPVATRRPRDQDIER